MTIENSNFILEWIEKLKIEIKSTSFVEDDIRRDFYEMIADSVHCYYRPYLLLNISILANEQKLDFSNLLGEEHFKAIKALTINPMSKKSHINSLNRNLILDAWSTFEVCISTFCKGVCNEIEIEKLLNHKYSDLKKLVPKDTLTNSQLADIKNKSSVEHLSHVPITRKTDILFKMSKEYSRDIELDKKFLLFFGKLRNTMHSNFIHYGSTFEYTYQGANFKFKNGDLVIWNDPFKSTPKLFFYLLDNLKDIWTALIHSIEFDAMIYYPNLNSD